MDARFINSFVPADATLYRTMTDTCATFSKLPLKSFLFSAVAPRLITVPAAPVALVTAVGFEAQGVLKAGVKLLNLDLLGAADEFLKDTWNAIKMVALAITQVVASILAQIPFLSTVIFCGMNADPLKHTPDPRVAKLNKAIEKRNTARSERDIARANCEKAIEDRETAIKDLEEAKRLKADVDTLLKEHEIKCDSLSKNLDKARVKLKDIKKAHRENELYVAEITGKLSLTAGNLGKLREDFEASQKQITLLTSERDVANALCEKITKKYELVRDQTEFVKAYDELEKECKTLKETSDGLDADLKKANLARDGIETKLEEARKGYEDLELKLNDAGVAHAELEKKLADASNEETRLKEEIKANGDEVIKLKDLIEEKDKAHKDEIEKRDIKIAEVSEKARELEKLIEEYAKQAETKLEELETSLEKDKVEIKGAGESKTTEVDALEDPSKTTEVDALEDPSKTTEVDALEDPSKTTEVKAPEDPSKTPEDSSKTPEDSSKTTV